MLQEILPLFSFRFAAFVCVDFSLFPLNIASTNATLPPPPP